MRTGHLSLCPPLSWMGASQTGGLPPCPQGGDKERTEEAVAGLPRGCPSPVAPEEAHLFIQQVFFILPQMGNSSSRIILKYEIRMFPITSLHLLSHLIILSRAASMSSTAFTSSPCCLPGGTPSLWGWGGRTRLLEERSL